MRDCCPINRLDCSFEPETRPGRKNIIRLIFMLKSPVKEREGGYLNLNLGVFAKQQQRFLSSTSINRKYILKSIVFPDYPSVLLMRATITGFFNPSRFCHPERSEASRFHCLVFLVLRDPSLRFYPSLKGLRQFRF